MCNQSIERIETWLEDYKAALGEHHFLFMFCQLSPMATKQTTKAAGQHKQEVMLKQRSPSVGKLDWRLKKMCQFYHIFH